ncbi:HCNGP-like protein-domain-containing protein, partial [Aspergillus avenaceus]
RTICDDGSDEPGAVPNDGDVHGPILGPSHEETQQKARLPHGHSSSLTRSRTLIHDLTLPPVPNLGIPSSPPGSPEPLANAKFARFLSLKKQDVHFNEKLAVSTSLKNPSLFRKLMEHAGIDDHVQHSTSLPREIWDLSKLPEWGFKEQLLREQKELCQKAEEHKAAGHRETIDFVTATPVDSTGATSMSNANLRAK